MNKFLKVKNYIQERGGLMISESIDNSHDRFIWECENNHKNMSKSQMLDRKSWCKKCKTEKTKKKTIETINAINYKLILYSPKKCIITCDHDHTINMSASHIIEGNKCGICYKNNPKIGHNKLNILEISSRLKKYNLKFLDSEYKSLRFKHKIECQNGHVFFKEIIHLIEGTSGCPDCNNYYKSERNFRQRIENILKIPFPKCRPAWLINPETNRRLELDCYNADYNLAFEFDGHFHFEIRQGLNNDIKRTQELDRIKDKLCKENKVVLIRVPYYLKGEEFYNKIIEGLRVVWGENYWYVIRAQEDETKPVPEDVSTARAAARVSIV